MTEIYSAKEKGKGAAILALILGVFIAVVTAIIDYYAIANMLATDGSGGDGIVFMGVPIMASFLLVIVGVVGALIWGMFGIYLKKSNGRERALFRIGRILLLMPWVGIGVVIVGAIVGIIVVY